MEQATNNLAQSLADRFTTLAHMLRKTLGAPEYSRFDLTLKWAIWHRISALALRFRSLALNPRPRRHRKPGTKSTTVSTPKRSELPRQNGWLLQTVPGHHIPYVRGHLIRFLDDPDLFSLLRDNPRVGRVLRPICHMLAIPLPTYLKLPRKPRSPRPKSEQKPEPKPARRSEKPEPSFYDYMLAKYPAPPPRPTLPGHIYAPASSPKINFER
ncbi:MAG: hypothetical protein ACP5M1_05665 [Acidiphilium sp.]